MASWPTCCVPFCVHRGVRCGRQATARRLPLPPAECMGIWDCLFGRRVQVTCARCALMDACCPYPARWLTSAVAFGGCGRAVARVCVCVCAGVPVCGRGCASQSASQRVCARVRVPVRLHRRRSIHLPARSPLAAPLAAVAATVRVLQLISEFTHHGLPLSLCMYLQV